ncbi:hypothetical protein [Pseudoduganella violaceinigra]|uniref:hypothetical protein n=1 Tax=Pseudoduganella violaceinigra TaxID=246602 RepID=UPI000482EC09|nr:hypothetical protein [Pseudoduganella violaceinigra]
MYRFFVMLAVAVLAPRSAIAEDRDWAFIQSVGGLAAGAPVLTQDGVVLPIRADVSGLQSITTKPTILNSAEICQSVRSTVAENSIYLTIATGFARRNRSSQCPAAILGKVRPGRYTLFYRGPDGAALRLSEIVIAGRLMNRDCSCSGNLTVL